MPRGVAALRRLGVALEAGVGVLPAGIRYVDAAGAHPAAEGRFDGGPGLGIRRTELHAALCARAGRLGVELLWNTQATALAADGIETGNGRVRARFVVGADGLHSRVRRWAGLAGRPARGQRYGLATQHYDARAWTDLVEVHWADGAEAYVTPVRGAVGVAFAGAGALDLRDPLARFPVLAGRLSAPPRLGSARCAGPFAQRVRAVARGNVALVGDARGTSTR